MNYIGWIAKMGIALFGSFIDLTSDEGQQTMEEIGEHQCH